MVICVLLLFTTSILNVVELINIKNSPYYSSNSNVQTSHSYILASFVVSILSFFIITIILGCIVIYKSRTFNKQMADKLIGESKLKSKTAFITDVLSDIVSVQVVNARVTWIMMIALIIVVIVLILVCIFNGLAIYYMNKAVSDILNQGLDASSINGIVKYSWIILALSVVAIMVAIFVIFYIFVSTRNEQKENQAIANVVDPDSKIIMNDPAANAILTAGGTV